MSAPAEKEYVGGCHCRKFRFKFTNAPFEDGAGTVDRCTCKFCAQKGALWLYIPERLFTLTSGSVEELTLYEFYKQVFKHYFCPTCGVQFFFKDTRGAHAEPMVAVNARTVDGVDPEKLSVKVFDGANIL